MSRKSAEQGSITRQRLLDAAVPLIGEVGWHKVTTRLVAERAGVNSGVVHYHFQSIQDLLGTACLSIINPILDYFLAQLREQDTVADGIDQIITQLNGMSGSEDASLVMTEAFLAAARIPELRQQLAEALARFRAGVADWLQSRQCPREYAEPAAALFAAAFDGIVLHRALDPDLAVAALRAPLIHMLTANPAR